MMFGGDHIIARYEMPGWEKTIDQAWYDETCIVVSPDLIRYL